MLVPWGCHGGIHADTNSGPAKKIVDRCNRCRTDLYPAGGLHDQRDRIPHRSGLYRVLIAHPHRSLRWRATQIARFVRPDGPRAQFFSPAALTKIRSLGGISTRWRRPAALAENFTSVFRNSVLISRHPAPTGGALRIVTKREAGCDGRERARDERRGCGRRNRMVLAPLGWR